MGILAFLITSRKQPVGFPFKKIKILLYFFLKKSNSNISTNPPERGRGWKEEGGERREEVDEEMDLWKGTVWAQQGHSCECEKQSIFLVYYYSVLYNLFVLQL